MSSPLLWIGLPAALAMILFLFRRFERSVAILATLMALSLAFLAWLLPVREQIFIGPWTLTFAETLSILGRRFTLAGPDRPSLVVLYLTVALWFGAAPIARTSKAFVPLGLGMVALLTAAIAVDPFLYAALLIEMAVLVSIPFLTSPGEQVGRGVLRYLTFQTLGMPFILFTGWMLEGVEANPGDSGLVVRIAVLIGLGFAFLLAVFPFYTWIPMLAQESHPYSASFVFLFLPEVVFILGLGFLDKYAWLRASPDIDLVLRSVGILMIVTAGLWAAFQSNLARLLGYALILELGFSFLAISLVVGEQNLVYLGEYFAMLVPRSLSLGVYALALSVIRLDTAEVSFRKVRGIAQRFPIAAASVVLAFLSMAGLPLLAAFPLRLSLLDGLLQVSSATALWALLGSVGLLIGGLRVLTVLVTGTDDTPWKMTETWWVRIYLILGCLGLLLLGLFPQWFLPMFVNLPKVFEQLAP